MPSSKADNLQLECVLCSVTNGTIDKLYTTAVTNTLYERMQCFAVMHAMDAFARQACLVAVKACGVHSAGLGNLMSLHILTALHMMQPIARA